MKIDFYIMQESSIENKIRFACKLVELAYSEKLTTYIHMPTESLANQIDTSLWTFKDVSFIPHAIVGVFKDNPPIIEIGFDQTINRQYDLLINFDPIIPEFYDKFKKIIEISENNEYELDLARKHYRFYKSIGSMPNTTDLRKPESIFPTSI